MSLSLTPIDKPASAAIGAQPRARDAYAALSRSDRQQLFATIRGSLRPPEEYIRIRAVRSPYASVAFARNIDLKVIDNRGFVTQAPPTETDETVDLDLDKLPDRFERKLANAFTPFYYVSAGERNMFAAFKDSPNLAIKSILPAVPVVSHYRVTPVGKASDRNGYLQIDYLTVWDRDDGLSISDTCVLASTGLGLSLEGLNPHEFDQERAAILVTAPLVDGEYSRQVGAYRLVAVYAAAHEGMSLFDQSVGWYVNPSAPAYSHVPLAITRAKHGTYAFYNPNKQPIFRAEFIAAIFAAIENLYLAGTISETLYLAALYAANLLFFECVVERFADQGGALAGTRTNVGELANPFNGCNWIRDPRIREKLEPLVFGVH